MVILHSYVSLPEGNPHAEFCWIYLEIVDEHFGDIFFVEDFKSKITPKVGYC
jgi:hypothetical protein